MAKEQNIQKKRESNLELYRIICMLMIVAHHFGGNYGILGSWGPVREDPFSNNSLFIYLFGMWGKTGINCFVLITGYFMCKSQITLNKFLKLYLWVITYQIIVAAIFLMAGRQQITWETTLILFPFRSIHSDSFVSAFMVWWLFIPFLNTLIENIDRKKHLLLIIMLVTAFTIYSTIPQILSLQGINPICWFSTLYIIAAYLRKYPETIYKSDSHLFWGFATFFSIVISMLSVVGILWVNKMYSLELPWYFFVSDSHKPLALIVAVFSFMWIKNIKLKYNKIINILGGSTFGVLLFHTIPAMRQWLWNDVFNCIHYFSLPFGKFVCYSVGVVVLVFVAGVLVDRIRIKIIEEPFFKWFDSKFAK